MTDKKLVKKQQQKQHGTPLLKALFLEHRLPWRYQKKVGKHLGKINSFLIRNLIFRRIRKTKRFTINPNADVEIHSITCHRDINLYLIAIKSFLRFYNDIAVLVHDDGTLTKEDKELLKKHITGVRIIERKEADKIVNLFLKSKPHCLLLRKNNVTSAQIFDYLILSKKRKIISLDSDTFFIKKPDEIINWIKNENNDCLFHSEKKIGFCDEARSKGLKLNGHLAVGFVCFFNDALDYNLIESNLIKCGELAKEFVIPQVLCDSCISNSRTYRYKPLNKKKYLIYYGHSKKELGNTKMVHFPSHLRYAQMHYIRFANQLVTELKQKIKNQFYLV